MSFLRSSLFEFSPSLPPSRAEQMNLKAAYPIFDQKT